MGNGMVNRITDSIRPKTLYKISNSYPELNTEWLKSGIGEMILDASISKNNTQNNSAFSGRVIPSSLNKILEAESLAAELLNQNRELTKQINTLMLQNSSLIDIITKNNELISILTNELRKQKGMVVGGDAECAAASGSDLER